MICPNCKEDNTKVMRRKIKPFSVRRTRRCKSCGYLFYTREFYIPDHTKGEKRKRIIRSVQIQGGKNNTK